VAFLAILCSVAQADVRYEIIGEGLATDISADGSVVVGNTIGAWETFRWTEIDGIVPLGMPSSLVGSMAGSPDVSADGTRVSATIAGADTTYVTQGLWIQGFGWQETMPPPPPDGGMMSDAYGSAWGLSDDGQTLVGLYWRPGQPGGSAHASAWTDQTGAVSLGSDGADSRANDVNADGSVIVGWSSNPIWGGWQPTVWVDGVMEVLESPDAFCEATTVNADGTLVGGYTYDPDINTRLAASWNWTGDIWEKRILGALPGTYPEYGVVIPNDMTPDGSVVVGYNAYDWTQSTGFIWTAESGMVDVEDFLVDNGIELDPWFDIQSLTGISDDGKKMVGIGQDMVPPFYNRSFIIQIEDETDVPTVTDRFAIGPNYPNPFNPLTTIPVTVAQRGPVRLEIVSADGRRVRVLHQGELAAGRHEFRWDGTDTRGAACASGVYLARIHDTAGSAIGRRMVLVK